MLYSIVGMLVIILDQAVKYWVSNTLFGYDVVKFIPGVISLVNVHNDGAAFSFLSGGGARIYFIIVTGVFALLVVIALASNFISTPVARWSLVFVTAGGLGNMIDRIMYGYVQDMFKVELFNFAIFNVADVFITVFAIVFVLAMFLEKPKPDDQEEWEDEEDEEEPEPEEKPRKLGRRKKAAQEEEDDVPAVSEAKKSRQKKQKKVEEEPVERSAKSGRRTEPVKQADTPSAEDPFAAWEKANQKAAAQKSRTVAARAAAEEPAAAPVPRSAAPARPAQRAQRPAQRPAAASARQTSVSAQQPAAKKSDSFDLDDILAEFK